MNFHGTSLTVANLSPLAATKIKTEVSKNGNRYSFNWSV